AASCRRPVRGGGASGFHGRGTIARCQTQVTGLTFLCARRSGLTKEPRRGGATQSGSEALADRGVNTARAIASGVGRWIWWFVRSLQGRIIRAGPRVPEDHIETHAARHGPHATAQLARAKGCNELSRLARTAGGADPRSTV